MQSTPRGARPIKFPHSYLAGQVGFPASSCSCNDASRANINFLPRLNRGHLSIHLVSAMREFFKPFHKDDQQNAEGNTEAENA